MVEAGKRQGILPVHEPGGGRSGPEDWKAPGRAGRTYWSEDRYESAREAKRRLALAALPEVRMQFTIRNDPHLRRAGDTVEPSGDDPGGGTEWMTPGAVEVIAVDNLE